MIAVVKFCKFLMASSQCVPRFLFSTYILGGLIVSSNENIVRNGYVQWIFNLLFGIYIIEEKADMINRVLMENLNKNASCMAEQLSGCLKFFFLFSFVSSPKERTFPNSPFSNHYEMVTLLRFRRKFSLKIAKLLLVAPENVVHWLNFKNELRIYWTFNGIIQTGKPKHIKH